MLIHGPQTIKWRTDGNLSEREAKLLKLWKNAYLTIGSKSITWFPPFKEYNRPFFNRTFCSFWLLVSTLNLFRIKKNKNNKLWRRDQNDKKDLIDIEMRMYFDEYLWKYLSFCFLLILIIIKLIFSSFLLREAAKKILPPPLLQPLHF